MNNYYLFFTFFKNYFDKMQHVYIGFWGRGSVCGKMKTIKYKTLMNMRKYETKTLNLENKCLFTVNLP